MAIAQSVNLQDGTNTKVRPLYTARVVDTKSHCINARNVVRNLGLL